MEALNNQAGYLFYQQTRKATDNIVANETRIPSYVKTYQNQALFQNTENLSRNYARVGQQKFADPFAFHMKPNDFSYDGRNLKMLNTLRMNATQDKPDVITVNPLRVVGFY
jgi:hypothetical protein